MNIEVPIIKTGQNSFVEIPSTVRLAILLPTARWTPMARSIIGSMVGVANEEVAVLVSDNSENPDKIEFLKKIRTINPNILAISHEKNIGSSGNFYYIHDWCKDIEFSAIMADDDWMSPTYHVDAYRALCANPLAYGASAGSTYVDIGDGKLVEVSQPSMVGASPFERISKWNAVAARVTTYNTSRRTALSSAIDFLRSTPLHGLTMLEDLWELSRLANGDFLTVPGNGCFVHYPAHGSQQGDGTKRFYDLLCKEAGLQYPFVYFTALTTAVLSAVYLMGNFSPISDPEQRKLCGDFVLKHIFTNSFLPKVSGESSHEAAKGLFVNHPGVMADYSKYCTSSYAHNMSFDAALVNWFIEIVKAFETNDSTRDLPLSGRLKQFIASALPAMDFN